MRLLWNGTDEWRQELCELTLADDGLVATGAQLGNTPKPYRAAYELEVRGGWVTRRLRVEVAGVGTLELRHDGKGTWSGAQGLDGVVDVDLAYSPLTNVMPVRRHALHAEPGAVDLELAWVSLPDLKVHRSAQRYEHLEPGRVRFSSGDFSADLELDEHGLVVRYPGLAQRAR